MEGSYLHGSESLDSDETVPTGLSFEEQRLIDCPSTSTSSAVLRGVETAKKKLRAFSIQKKAAVPPVTVVKPVCTGNTTVLIGKLSAVKTTPKPEKPPDDDQKKLPKPPKPGSCKKNFNESYTELQKKTLSEIEEMKRKMELVELGIPLGLVCPSTNALPVKVMPTKAMPPIKTFLDNAKIDEIILEARKAKAEGKEFKFDYQKFVPDYDNPFQRKRDNPEEADKTEDKKEEEFKKYRSDKDRDRDRFKDRRKSDRYDRRYDYKRDDRDRRRDKERREKKEESRSRERDNKSRDRDRKSREKDDKYKNFDKSDKKEAKIETPKDTEVNKEEVKKIEIPAEKDKDIKETDVNLSEYLVCDSWSLDAEGKNSPQITEKTKKALEDKPKKALQKTVPAMDPLEQLRQSLGKSKPESPKQKFEIIEKLKPVEDSFDIEIDPNDESLDIYDEYNKFSKTKPKKGTSYDSTGVNKYDRKDLSSDGNDDAFMESIINEIKEEHMTDDETHDKGLVEYDASPGDSKDPSNGSVTPDLDDNTSLSHKSDYSDGCKSTDSRKSIESGYKSTESYKSENKTGPTQISDTKTQKSESEFRKARFKSTFKPAVTDSKPSPKERRSRSPKSDSKSKKAASEERDLLSVERELDRALEAHMTKDTVHSLETWSFILKICQPLLFRHDKNKCYRETRVAPKLWFTQNPKLCDCVTDRAIVYQELDACKMDLVDRLYSCEQIPDSPQVIARSWYPQQDQCIMEHPAPKELCSEWDIDDDQARSAASSPPVSLDREYQRFMEAVSWPDSSQPSQEAPMTPDRQERKTKVEDQLEGPKEAKRIKLSSEGWSQESEDEEPKPAKADKLKQKMKRKRKLSTASVSDNEAGDKKRKKIAKKKDGKKPKSKIKSRRLEKKMLKKLKVKKKRKKVEVDTDMDDEEKDSKKKDKKSSKKKKLKVKKKVDKKKKRSKSTSTSSESSSSSDSSSDSELPKKKKKKGAEVKKKKKKEKKKKRKQSSSDSQSEELFDVNILNNIKTERLTDDERRQDASPVRVPREIINVKQLHDDFSSNIQVKQEIEEEIKPAVAESPKQPESKATSITVEETREEATKDDSKIEDGSKTQDEKTQDDFKRKDGQETKDSPKIKEVVKTQESLTIKQSPDTSASTKIQESPKIKDSPVSASPKIKDSPISVPKKHESPISASPKIREIPRIQESPLIKVKEDPKTHESPKIKDSPIKNASPKIIESTRIQESPISASPKIRESPRIQESPKIKEDPKTHESTKVKDSPISVSPKIREGLKSQESPKIKDSPVPYASPKIRESFRSQESPSIRHSPIASCSPKIKDSPKTKSPKIRDSPRLNEQSRASEYSLLPHVEVARTVISEAELMNRFDLGDQIPTVVKNVRGEFKEPEVPTPPPRVDDTSQCSQESTLSIGSVKPAYEQDMDHLRPPCDNSNYSFNDVMSSHSGYKLDDKFDGFENYEMYEQMAMAYQSDVASQQISPPSSSGEQRIETVVRARSRGEIKCDWRASDNPHSTNQASHMPSRWGLKPGEVNIVLTGGGDHPDILGVRADNSEQVYRIQSLANRSEPIAMSYDEAYMDTYGAMDRLQYGDCFAPVAPPRPVESNTATPSLDARINSVLNQTVQEVATESAEKETPDKGILVTKSLSGRGAKRVSFADGYKPGQDSDTEQPPPKKRKRPRRVGCAWPCPASHPDHVPLWDALPPPPPPPGSPPPPAHAPPPTHLLRAQQRHSYSQHQPIMPVQMSQNKFNPAATIPSFIPPEPPAGLITFP